MKVIEVTELMPFLIKQLPGKSRDNIKSLLKHRQVIVDGKPVSQYNHLLKPGQQVELFSERLPREKSFREYNIVFEDHHLIVIDKHAGLLSISTENEKRHTAYSLLSEHVKRQDPDNKIFVVHRLDRETSGLMVFAKNETIKFALQKYWEESVIERNYIAVVEGIVTQQSGTITSWLWEDKNYFVHSTNEQGKGQWSVSNFITLKTSRENSMLRFNLETGRKNQIRVHSMDMGHSIAGDKKYGAKTNPLKRLGLHAQSLSFIHPVTSEKLNFETNIPRSFQALFKD